MKSAGKGAHTHPRTQTHAFINNAIFCFRRSDAIGAHEHEGECRRPIAHSRVPTAKSRVPIADCPQPSRTSCCCLRFSIPDAMQLAIRTQCVSQSLWVQRDGRRRAQPSSRVEQSSSSSIDESRQSRAVANAVAVAVGVAAKIETKLNNNVRSTIDLKAKPKQKGPTSACNVQWGGSNTDSTRLWWLPQAFFPYCASSVSTTTTTRRAVQNLKEKQQKTEKKNRFARLVCLPFAQFGRRKMRLPSC